MPNEEEVSGEDEAVGDDAVVMAAEAASHRHVVSHTSRDAAASHVSRGTGGAEADSSSTEEAR